MKILYIEDEAPLRQLYERVCVTNNCEFCAAENVDHGLELTKTVKPNAVLLDLMFPGNNNGNEEQGYIYLRRVKDDAEIQHIPIVAFSNLDTVSDREKARELGASAYLLKRDCMPNEVLEVLIKLIKEKHQI